MFQQRCPGLSKARKRAPRRRRQPPEDIKRRSVTGAGGEEAQRRKAGRQDWRHKLPLVPEGTGPAVESGRGEGVVR